MQFDPNQLRMLINVLVQSGLGNQVECETFVRSVLIPFAENEGYDDLLKALADFPAGDPEPGTIEYQIALMLDRVGNRVH